MLPDVTGGWSSTTSGEGSWRATASRRRPGRGRPARLDGVARRASHDAAPRPAEPVRAGPAERGAGRERVDPLPDRQGQRPRSAWRRPRARGLAARMDPGYQGRDRIHRGRHPARAGMLTPGFGPMTCAAPPGRTLGKDAAVDRLAREAVDSGERGGAVSAQHCSPPSHRDDSSSDDPPEHRAGTAAAEPTEPGSSAQDRV